MEIENSSGGRLERALGRQGLREPGVMLRRWSEQTGEGGSVQAWGSRGSLEDSGATPEMRPREEGQV